MDKEQKLLKKLQELNSKKETNKALSDFYWYWQMQEISPEVWLQKENWSYYYNNTPMRLLLPLLDLLK